MHTVANSFLASSLATTPFVLGIAGFSSGVGGMAKRSAAMLCPDTFVGIADFSSASFLGSPATILTSIGSTLASIGAYLASAWGTVWPYLAIMLGFSLIIFVHELGHFSVAKWADVRVERFAIGFGKELFGFTRGETRYSFNILPLGGYVKMLGQEDFDDKSEELKFKADPRSFANKPVGPRMAIVSAGVIMNLIFACLAFMVVFMIGMDALAPRIASVEADSPAEKAGLAPGDVVKEINGEKVLEFNEVRFAVLLAAKHQDIDVLVERNGEPKRFRIEPLSRRPNSSRDVRRQMIGIAPGVSTEIVGVGPEIDTSKPDQPHIGDRIVEVDGVAVTKDNASQMFNRLGYAQRDVYVERKNPKTPDAPPERVKVTIPPVLSIYPSSPDDPSSVSVLGLTPLVRVDAVDPRGRAFLAGIEVGDTILQWDDRWYPTQADIARSIADSAERDIAFRVRRTKGNGSYGTLRPKRNDRGTSTIQAGCESTGESATARFANVRGGGVAARAGIEDGDEILSFFGNERPTCATVQKVVRSNDRKPLTCKVRKQDGRDVTVELVPESPGSAEVWFRLVADDLLVTGEPVRTIGGRPSPATVAGIPAGAMLNSVNGESVSKWRDLIEAFRKHAGKSVELAYTDSAKQTHSAAFRVPHTVRTMLGVGPEARIVRIDGRETVTTPIERGGERLSVQYHEGARELLSQLVGRNDVVVEYRENPLAELRQKAIAVSDDMMDDWLGRVSFSPNVVPDEERFSLKGANAWEAMQIGVHKTYYFIKQVYVMMERMFFTRSVGFENMAGPLGIIDMGGKVARTGGVEFLFFLAMVSANLAVLNFLPLPIVDGGLMVFLIIEKIKGSPVSLRVQVATQMIGLVLIISTFLFVTYQDVVRLWG